MSGLKQFEVLKRASLFLEKYDREPRVAEILLQHHLNVSRSTFFMNMQENIPQDVVDDFFKDIEEHAKTGIPVQHIIGYEEFYGRRYFVNKHVLIPRPETEELVMSTIENIKKRNWAEPNIVDVGTGSGIIATTLSLEVNGSKVFATDISEEALDVAKRNCAQLQAAVEFLQGDFLEPLINEQMKVNVIVSNPPYIAEVERDSLSDTVKNFDPELALFAEDNGLAAYKKIILQAKEVLTDDGIIAFEIGHMQGEAVKLLVSENFPQFNVDIIQDINGKDRIVLAIST